MQAIAARRKSYLNIAYSFKVDRLSVRVNCRYADYASSRFPLSKTGVDICKTARKDTQDHCLLGRLGTCFVKAFMVLALPMFTRTIQRRSICALHLGLAKCEYACSPIGIFGTKLTCCLYELTL